eukprot:NODE_5998_length_616_cov_423.155203_g5595_i0.p2 GENE.NODE_5998_length_616_cov_423.155203_g5595_i0~~NODE_5998_length_616_cov_423.155203_g5595_i0.p2  ORF type:complete len:104 (-),score=36.01 NODE_5998_length_616_cov_423.155203_g5595_i0:190-501(-)
MGGNASSILKKIDQSGGSTDKEIDKLFDKLDKDRSGSLDGKEYQAFFDDATKYMLADLKKSGHDYDEPTISGWLKQWLDPNGDGKVTRAELKANLKAVLDAGE